jgi:hypothetical protein
MIHIDCTYTEDGMSGKGYDSRCGDLAEVFLEDEHGTEAEVAELAQCIQDAIEDWFEARTFARAEATEGK